MASTAHPEAFRPGPPLLSPTSHSTVGKEIPRTMLEVPASEGVSVHVEETYELPH